MTNALISFGANLTGRNDNLASILADVSALLAEFKEITDVLVGRGFRTPAFPPGSGPDFLNAALSVQTSLGPIELLAALHRIEGEMGRTRTRRWEPRVCDLDLLAMGDSVLPDRRTVLHWMDLDDVLAMASAPPDLILPHPRLHRRGFVLVPLADIAPEWRHPILDRTVTQMLDQIAPADLADIRPY